VPAGSIYDNGSVRLEIVRAARDTGGRLLEMSATYAPGSPPPPRHLHPEQTETFTIRKGALRFELDDAVRLASAGEEVVVPRATVHSIRNASDRDEAVVTWVTRPALRTEQMFAALYDATRGGKTKLLPVSLVFHEFHREIALAKPPRIVQTCVFGLLAPIARMLGHRVEG
jgi:quercetin dioxygenase-like cupin family protein